MIHSIDFSQQIQRLNNKPVYNQFTDEIRRYARIPFHDWEHLIIFKYTRSWV